MGVSNQLIIDITNSLHRAGEVYTHVCHLQLDNNLLPYAYATWSGDVLVDIDYRSIDGEVDVIGDITLSYSGGCDRCGDIAVNSLVVSLEETFYPHASNTDDYTYSGNKLDLTQAIIDNILLQLPTSLLCSEQCKGLCPVCGTNLTVSQCECTKIQQ